MLCFVNKPLIWNKIKAKTPTVPINLSSVVLMYFHLIYQIFFIFVDERERER